MALLRYAAIGVVGLLGYVAGSYITGTICERKLTTKLTQVQTEHQQLLDAAVAKQKADDQQHLEDVLHQAAEIVPLVIADMASVYSEYSRDYRAGNGGFALSVDERRKLASEWAKAGQVFDSCAAQLKLPQSLIRPDVFEYNFRKEAGLPNPPF